MHGAATEALCIHGSDHFKNPLASFGLTPFVRLIAVRGGAVDHPDARKRHRTPTPKLGGVAVLSAFVLALGRAATVDREMLAISAAAITLMLAGALDDTRGLSARLRLGLQLVCSLAVIAAGVRLNLLSGPAGVAGNVVLSVLWIVGITNAYNFIDGLNGLAGGIAVVACATMVVVGAKLGNVVVLMPVVALAGALFGFLRPRAPNSIRHSWRALLRRCNTLMGYDSSNAGRFAGSICFGSC